MKKLIYLAICLLLNSLVLVSCSKKKVSEPVPEPRLNPDSLNLGLMYVEQAYRHLGKDSADLFVLNDVYDTFRRNIFLVFPQQGDGPVYFYTGQEMPNTTIAGPARTFGLTYKILYPTGLRCEWNQEKGTLIVKSVYTPGMIRFIVPGKAAFLDPAHSKIVHSLAESREANRSGVNAYVTFVYEDIDPELGKVTYKLRLKQLFRYHTDPEEHWARCAFY